MASVRFLEICFIHASQGWLVIPAISTRRVWKSIAKKTK